MKAITTPGDLDRDETFRSAELYDTTPHHVHWGPHAASSLAGLSKVIVSFVVVVAVGLWLVHDSGGQDSQEPVHQRYLALSEYPLAFSHIALESSGCRNVCGNVAIPYPFGLSLGCARAEQFLLACEDNENVSGVLVQPGPWPYMTTASGSFTDLHGTLRSMTLFQVLDITSTTMIINTTAIKAMGCGEVGDPNVSGVASLVLPADGTYISTRQNVFYVSGCNSEGNYSSVWIDGTTASSTCGPNSCENQHSFPYCNLYDCCTATMPPWLQVELNGGGIAFEQFDSCGFVSMLYPPTYSSTHPPDIGIGTYGLELHWSLLVNSTLYPNCTVIETMSDYACSEQASCTTVTEKLYFGYVCECIRTGFQGDGYKNGTKCGDINECEYPDSNECSPAAICKNLEGSYMCTCQDLMEGDGFRNGTNCTYIDNCANGRQNDCVADAICNSANGLYNCTCVGDLVGDGRKSGSGCRNMEKSNTPLIAGVVVAGVVFSTVNGLLIWWQFQRSKRRKGLFGDTTLSRRDLLVDIQSKEGANICKLYTYEELEKATNHFSEDYELGSGAFGTVFKGTLDDGKKVAIKKAKRDVGGRDDTKQFINEVTILSQVNHRNLVQLFGCCLDRDIPILVYEFISNGNLMEHIQPQMFEDHSRGIHRRPRLDWNKRLKIAIGTAEALTYLHSGTSRPIYHRDVKPANILLDEHYVAKVADFGLSKFVPVEATHLSTKLQGTPGYLDPDYLVNFQITDKSDVYSFGIVLLELVTSEKAVDFSRPAKDHNLALRCSRFMMQGRLEDIIDPMLGASTEPQMLDEIHAVARLAMRCVERLKDDRPTMTEVSEQLRSLSKPTKKRSTAIEKSKSHKNVRFEEVYLLDGTSTDDSYNSSDQPTSAILSTSASSFNLESGDSSGSTLSISGSRHARKSFPARALDALLR